MGSSPACKVHLRLVLGPMLVALTLPMFGQLVKQPTSSLDALFFEKRELRVSQTLADADTLLGALPYRDDLARFKALYGASWHFIIDLRTGRPNLIDGGAIPFIPGAASPLPWDDSFGNCRAAACIAPTLIETLARDFLRRNQAVVQVNPDDLVLDPATVAPIGNSMYVIRFQWRHHGLPVEGGSVFLTVNNGNLIQIGIKDVADIRLDTNTGISRDAAWVKLRTYLSAAGGGGDTDDFLEKGLQVILPITPLGMDPDRDDVPFGQMR